MSARDRLSDDGFEVFEPTAGGILRWVETTRPPVPRDVVVAHARELHREGGFSRADLERLAAAGYPELAAS